MSAGARASARECVSSLPKYNRKKRDRARTHTTPPPIGSSSSGGRHDRHGTRILRATQTLEAQPHAAKKTQTPRQLSVQKHVCPSKCVCVARAGCKCVQMQRTQLPAVASSGCLAHITRGECALRREALPRRRLPKKCVCKAATVVEGAACTHAQKRVMCPCFWLSALAFVFLFSHN